MKHYQLNYTWSFLSKERLTMLGIIKRQQLYLLLKNFLCANITILFVMLPYVFSDHFQLGDINKKLDFIDTSIPEDWKKSHSIPSSVRCDLYYGTIQSRGAWNLVSIVQWYISHGEYVLTIFWYCWYYFKHALWFLLGITLASYDVLIFTNINSVMICEC